MQSVLFVVLRFPAIAILWSVIFQVLLPLLIAGVAHSINLLTYILTYFLVY